jgi:hypothetical protein
MVPASRRSSATAASRRPIAAIWPVASANRQAASTFGPMEPTGNKRARSWRGVARRMGRASWVPKLSVTASTSVSSSRALAFTARAGDQPGGRRQAQRASLALVPR